MSQNYDDPMRTRDGRPRLFPRAVQGLELAALRRVRALIASMSQDERDALVAAIREAESKALSRRG